MAQFILKFLQYHNFRIFIICFENKIVKTSPGRLNRIEHSIRDRTWVTTRNWLKETIIFLDSDIECNKESCFSHLYNKVGQERAINVYEYTYQAIPTSLRCWEKFEWSQDVCVPLSTHFNALMTTRNWFYDPITELFVLYNHRGNRAKRVRGTNMRLRKGLPLTDQITLPWYAYFLSTTTK